MSLLYPSTILSEIVKPLSATNVSPGNNLYNIPQFSERNLLEVRPPQASETKDTEERTTMKESHDTTNNRTILNYSP